MLVGDVEDEFLDQDGFANARAAKEADLAALNIRAKQIDDFDAGLQNLVGDVLLAISRRVAVNRAMRLFGEVAVLSVDRLAEDVEHTPQGLFADRDGDRGMGVLDLHAADQAFGGAHRDRADDVVADVLHDLDGERMAILKRNLEGGEDFR